MAFQTVDSSQRLQGRGASNTTPTVSYYGKTSQFRLNAPAVALLGNPEKVEVMHDADTNRVAFVPSDSVRALTLRSDSETAGSRYFGFKSLANLLGIPEGARVSATLTRDEESGYAVATFTVDVAEAAPAAEETEAAPAAEETEEATASRRSR